MNTKMKKRKRREYHTTSKDDIKIMSFYTVSELLKMAGYYDDTNTVKE